MARNTNGTGFSLKDELFNKDSVTVLAAGLADSLTQFNATSFVNEVCREFPKLELKERISHIADVLERYLSKDFSVAAQQIVRALPEPLDPTKTDDDFGSFIYAPYGEFIVRHGCVNKHYKLALKTLKEVTMRFSMEDAIRAFINEFPDQTYKTLTQWATNKNYHVRRLVSEGSRPLLPWSSRLEVPHTWPVEFLDTLHADTTRYVTRSVANHLNDISKSDPDLVIATLQKWHNVAKQDKAELDWMTRHALRTLVKKGNTEALNLLGFSSKPAITVSNIRCAPKTVTLGEAVYLTFDITAKQDELLLVDYVVDFVKANGTTAPKVFKCKQLAIKKGETITIEKRHPFKKSSSTFTFYSGKHSITVQINGQSFGSIDFTLTV